MKSLLIQANGNNIRLSKYFKQPKYELYFNGVRIIDSIINNGLSVFDKIYVAVRKNVSLNFDTHNVQIINCEQTTSRLDTLKQCFDFLLEYDDVVVHDCDVIIESDVLKKLKNNSLAITNYKLDGLKYGFVELDENFNYIRGNEKTSETGHISIGAYCVNTNKFSKYLETAKEESLLEYYNECSDTKVVYSKNHTNLGDINSYINNLWLL